MKPDYPTLISEAIDSQDVELARSLHASFSATAESALEQRQVHNLGNKIQVLIFNQYFGGIDRPLASA